MAVKEEYEIYISKDGEVKVIAKGFDGKTCEIPMSKLKKILDEAGLSKTVWDNEYYKTMGTVDAKVKK